MSHLFKGIWVEVPWGTHPRGIIRDKASGGGTYIWDAFRIRHLGKGIWGNASVMGQSENDLEGSGLCGIIRNDLESFEFSSCGSIWDHLGSSGIIYVHLGSPEIVWFHLKSGIIFMQWHHSATVCAISMNMLILRHVLKVGSTKY